MVAKKETLSPPEKSALRYPSATEDDLSPFKTRDLVRRTFMGTAIKALEEGRKLPPRDPFEDKSTPDYNLSTVANPPTPFDPNSNLNSNLNHDTLPEIRRNGGRTPSQRFSQYSDISENISVAMLQRGKSLKSTHVEIPPVNPRRDLSATNSAASRRTSQLSRPATLVMDDFDPFEHHERSNTQDAYASLIFGQVEHIQTASLQRPTLTPPESPNTSITLNRPPQAYYPQKPSDPEKAMYYSNSKSKSKSRPNEKGDPQRISSSDSDSDFNNSCACLIL